MSVPSRVSADRVSIFTPTGTLTESKVKPTLVDHTLKASVHKFNIENEKL